MNGKNGEFLVKTARKAIERFVRSGEVYMPEEYPKEFNKKGGVFVTINTSDDRKLRGCIGYAEPVLPIIKALTEAAVSVTRDPRFPPLDARETGMIIVEVSVLTEPELVRVKKTSEYPKKIKIGRDGLIIEGGGRKGLLLPQVPVEWKWDAEEFLENLCLKAGLGSSDWMNPDNRVYSFHTEIFSETEPNGPVKKV